MLVAAVGALAARLHEQHSVAALAWFAALFVPVWWVWWAFTWYSAAFNADDATNRVALLAAMLGVAALAAGIPGADSRDSALFAVAYGALFTLLTALYVRAWRHVPEMRSLSGRYAAADAAGAALWLASLVVDEQRRPIVWAAAMVVLMGGPVLAASSTSIVAYEPDHIAERYALFTLIVLGESIVAIVAGLDARREPSALLIAVLGLVMAAAIWWLYFDRFRGMPGRTIRAGFVWAQGHLLIFAGIAAAAVGIEFAIETAAEHGTLQLADRLSLGAGLSAYLVAMATIRAATRGRDWIAALRLGAAAIVLALAFAPGLAPLTYVALTATTLVAECAADLIGAPPARPSPPRLPHQLARDRSTLQ